MQNADIISLRSKCLSKLLKNMVGIFNTLRMVESFTPELDIGLMPTTKRRTLFLSMMSLLIMKMLRTTYFERKI